MTATPTRTMRSWATQEFDDEGTPVLLPASYSKRRWRVTSISEQLSAHEYGSNYQVTLAGPVVNKSGSDHANQRESATFSKESSWASRPLAELPERFRVLLVGPDALKAWPT